jgi:hypothetical protein
MLEILNSLVPGIEKKQTFCVKNGVRAVARNTDLDGSERKCWRF